jgi:hypothetical protein
VLPESAFCERELAYLDVNIVSPAAQTPPDIYHVALLLVTVARKCPHVEVTLRLSASELQKVPSRRTGMMFPRVSRVAVPFPAGFRPAYQNDYWSSLFAGRVFPDLCQLETNGFEGDLAGLPPSIAQQFVSAIQIAEQGHHEPDYPVTIQVERLEYLRNLKIECDIMLNQAVLLSLFGTSCIPTRLTTLEIVSCPKLSIPANLPALSTLLQPALTSLPA